MHELILQHEVNIMSNLRHKSNLYVQQKFEYILVTSHLLRNKNNDMYCRKLFSVFLFFVRLCGR